MVADDCDLSDVDITDVDLKFIKTVTLNDAYMFLLYCKEDRSNDASARARKVSAIRTFFGFLKNKKGVIDDNPLEELEVPKVKKSLPKYLTLDQSLALLNAVEGPNKERDYLILTLFLNCGMRLSELCGLNLKDIKSDGSIKVTGKGNKDRIIYLNDACTAALNMYLPVRPVDGVKHADRDALLISRLKRRISPKTVQLIVKSYLDKAGMADSGFSTHKLRHTAATLMYQHGNVDIRVLKDILGHENLNTTEIYTHITNKQIQKAADANPLAGVKNSKNKKGDNNG